jgi:hypothetical protein
MVNSSEVPINAVSNDKPKMLTGLDQKVRGQAQVLLTHLTQMLSHRRRGTTSPTRALTRNVVSPSFSLKGFSSSRKASRKVSQRDGRDGRAEKSEGWSVMDWIGVES